MENELKHYGIPGQMWYLRRFQNKDGSLTPEGKERYAKIKRSEIKRINRKYNKANSNSDKKITKYKNKLKNSDNKETKKHYRNKINDIEAKKAFNKVMRSAEIKRVLQMSVDDAIHEDNEVIIKFGEGLIKSLYTFAIKTYIGMPSAIIGEIMNIDSYRAQERLKNSSRGV